MVPALVSWLFVFCLASGHGKVSVAISRAPAVKTRLPVTAKRTKAPRWPTIELFHVNRRETFRLCIADSKGRPVRGLQRRVDQFLRCHYTNTRHRMNPRLTRLVYEAGRHWPGRRVEIVSGYRAPSVAKNPHSPHKLGLACDFRIAGVKNTELRDYLRGAFPHIGVGYYPNSSFVHLDVRQGASAFWIDYSGPGENAVYSENAKDDLKTGRADTFKPTKIDPAWADDDEAFDRSGTSPSQKPDPATER